MIWFNLSCFHSPRGPFYIYSASCFRWQVNAYCSNHFDHHHQIKCACGMALTIWFHLDQYDLSYGPSELGPLILIALSTWASWCTCKVDFLMVVLICESLISTLKGLIWFVCTFSLFWNLKWCWLNRDGFGLLLLHALIVLSPKSMAVLSQSSLYLSKQSIEIGNVGNWIEENW